jgi:hypothetical protein
VTVLAASRDMGVRCVKNLGHKALPIPSSGYVISVSLACA